MLKEALASNTIGGKVDDESRWRAAGDEVEQARAKWMRIGPVPREVRRALDDRFARAARTITERVTARVGVPRRIAPDAARRAQHPGSRGTQPARKAPPRMAAAEGGQERSRS